MNSGLLSPSVSSERAEEIEAPESIRQGLRSRALAPRPRLPQSSCRMRTLFPSSPEKYEEELRRGLKWTGENRRYFAARRIFWLRKRLVEEGGSAPRSILDFGCGLGDALELFGRWPEVERLVGADADPRMLARARETLSDPRARFIPPEALPALAPFDLVYLNGVLHHIPPPDRPPLARRLAAMGHAADAVRSGRRAVGGGANPLSGGSGRLARGADGLPLPLPARAPIFPADRACSRLASAGRPVPRPCKAALKSLPIAGLPSWRPKLSIKGHQRLEKCVGSLLLRPSLEGTKKEELPCRRMSIDAQNAASGSARR